jgi:hypothetical protein
VARDWVRITIYSYLNIEFLLFPSPFNMEPVNCDWNARPAATGNNNFALPESERRKTVLNVLKLPGESLPPKWQLRVLSPQNGNVRARPPESTQCSFSSKTSSRFILYGQFPAQLLALERRVYITVSLPKIATSAHDKPEREVLQIGRTVEICSTSQAFPAARRGASSSQFFLRNPRSSVCMLG